MSDVFFITSTVCVVIITLLLSILLLKLITSVDDANVIITKAKTTTENISKAVGVVASATAVVSPFFGVAKKILKRGK